MTAAVTLSTARFVPFYVYVLYDRNHRPLYVGCSHEVGQRLSTHRAKDWGADIAFYDVERYPQVWAAMFREALLIEDLQPLHNVRPGTMPNVYRLNLFRYDRGIAKLEHSLAWVI